MKSFDVEPLREVQRDMAALRMRPKVYSQSELYSMVERWNRLLSQVNWEIPKDLAGADDVVQPQQPHQLPE